MNVVVHFFARARDLAGTGIATVELPEASTVKQLRALLAESYPGLAGLLHRSAFAVADELAEDDVILQPNALVALLPPVSGG